MPEEKWENMSKGALEDLKEQIAEERESRKEVRKPPVAENKRPDTAEKIIDDTAHRLIDGYFNSGNSGFSKNCIKAILREMMLKIDSLRAVATYQSSLPSYVGEKEARTMLSEVLAKWREK
jgi:hypothetical protein